MQSLWSLKTEHFKAEWDDIYCTQLHIQANISKNINISTNIQCTLQCIYLCIADNKQKLNKYYNANIPAYMTIKNRTFVKQKQVITVHNFIAITH